MTDALRSKFFPAIEKKHGQPIEFWIERLGELGDAKYPQQIAYLREEHGFSQAHANALVMYVRGSTSSKRFSDPEQCLASMPADAQATAREILAAVMKRFPKLELVVAWNKPMLRVESGYVLGISAAKNHVLLAPFGTGVLDRIADVLEGYEVNKKTVRVPIGWKVDRRLLDAMVRARLAELA